jgi:hypothetical protein
MNMQKSAEVRVVGVAVDERTKRVKRKLPRALVVGGGAVGVKLIRRAEIRQWTG